jgi:hypothetical protein
MNKLGDIEVVSCCRVCSRHFVGRRVSGRGYLEEYVSKAEATALFLIGARDLPVCEACLNDMDHRSEAERKLDKSWGLS